jgi:hypothetical protein
MARDAPAELNQLSSGQSNLSMSPDSFSEFLAELVFSVESARGANLQYLDNFIQLDYFSRPHLTTDVGRGCTVDRSRSLVACTTD